MLDASIPLDEQDRLAELYSLKILDTPPEERFDRITKMATKVLGAKISTLTLVDSHREWYKSCQGLSTKEVPRAISFCGHAILENEPLVIPDTLQDQRFSDNPMVTGEPFIRFYAGKPLFGPKGFRVGVFCVKDTRPRLLSEEEFDSFLNLAAWAELELNSQELVNALASLRDAEAEKRKLLVKQMESEKINEQHQMISTLSHQLRTPISAIRGGLEELHQTKADQQLVIKLNDQIESLNSLVSGLLFFLEVGHNYQVTIREEIDLSEVIKQRLAQMDRAIKKKNLKVELRIETHSGSVIGDKRSLAQVIDVLLRNAIDYSLKNGGIEIDQRLVGEQVVVSITDHGIGIPKSDQDKLFEAFFRGSNVSLSEKYEGTGVSLFIARQIVVAHQGNLVFSSTEDQGTTFNLSLPAVL